MYILTKYNYKTDILDALENNVISGHINNIDGADELKGDYEMLDLEDEEEDEKEIKRNKQYALWELGNTAWEKQQT